MVEGWLLMVVAPRERAEQRGDLKAAGHLDRASIGPEEKVSDYKHPQDFTERKKHKSFLINVKYLCVPPHIVTDNTIHRT